MKKLLLSAFVAFAMLASTKTFAQQGFGTNTPSKSAAVDIVSSQRGLLIPRLDLSNITVASPVDAPAHGLLVYNKATSALTGPEVANNVTPGFYYWERNNTTTETAWQGKWVRIVSSNTEKKVVVEEGNNVKVVEDVTGLTTTYTVSVEGGTKNGQVLVSIPNPDPATVATEPYVSEWVDPDDFIKGVNGINVTTDNNGNTNVGLGGDLSTPTVIKTTATNTLAIDGLTVLDNAAFDPAMQNIVVMGSDGILKEVSPKTLIEDTIDAGTLAAKKISSAGGIITINNTTELTNSVLKDVELGIANKSIGAEKLNPGTAIPGQIATVVTNGGSTEIQYQDPSTAIGKDLTTDNIIQITGSNADSSSSAIGTVLKDIKLEIGANSITAAQIGTGAVDANELAAGAVTADKLSTKDSENGTVAAPNTVPVANSNGTVTYKTVAEAAGEDLTTDGKIVIGQTGATSNSLTDAVLVATRLSIAPESITSADIKDGTITTTDIKAPNSSTDNNLGGDENMVMVTDTNGDVKWIAQSALANKDNYAFVAPLSKDAGTPNTTTGGTDYTVSIATASATTLGVVKQSAATGEEITIATDGSLSINEANVKVGLDSNNAAQGDVSGTLSNLTVGAIQGIPVSDVDPTSTNNMLVFQNGRWEPSTVAAAAGKTLTGTGITVSAGTTAGTGTSLAQSVLADVTLGIANDAITSEKIEDGEVKTDDLANTSVTAGKLVAATDGTDLNKIPVANLNGSVEYKDAAAALGKQLTSTSITVSTPTNQALLQDLNIEIKPGTAVNQILTTVDNAGTLTTDWVTPNSLVTVANGLNKENIDIELGGVLKRTTVITTGVNSTNDPTPANTLGVQGLIVPATASTEIMYAEGTTGVLRKAARSVSQYIEASQVVSTITGYNDFVQEVNITAKIVSGDINVTLPAATATNKGQVVNVKITNTAEVADYLNILVGSTTLTYGALPYQSWIIKSNGTSWEIVGRN